MSNATKAKSTKKAAILRAMLLEGLHNALRLDRTNAVNVYERALEDLEAGRQISLA